MTATTSLALWVKIKPVFANSAATLRIEEHNRADGSSHPAFQEAGVAPQVPNAKRALAPIHSGLAAATADAEARVGGLVQEPPRTAQASSAHLVELARCEGLIATTALNEREFVPKGAAADNESKKGLFAMHPPKVIQSR